MGNFYRQIRLYDNKKLLVFTKGWGPLQKEELDKGDFDVLVLDHGDWGRMEWIKDYADKINGLVLFDPIVSAHDIYPLVNLKEITLYSYGGAKCEVDFTNFTKLESCVLEGMNKCYETIFSVSSLKSLHITGYKSSSLEGFSGLGGLENLTLINAKQLSCLTGIESLKMLKGLILSMAPALANIGPLVALEQLITLELGGVKGVTDFSPIGSLRNIKKLTFDKVANVLNLSFLAGLEMLESIMIMEPPQPVERVCWEDLLLLPHLNFFQIPVKKEHEYKIEDLANLCKMNGRNFKSLKVIGTKSKPIFKMDNR